MDSAPDPLGEIETAVIALLRRANDPRGFQRIHELAGTDVERSGAVMLSRIEELQPARLSDVAAAANLDISTASRQVAKLVDSGYVERATDPADARAALHSLTPAGADVRARLRAASSAFFERILEDFSDAEREAFATLISRFVAGVLESTNRPVPT